MTDESKSEHILFSGKARSHSDHLVLIALVVGCLFGLAGSWFEVWLLVPTAIGAVITAAWSLRKGEIVVSDSEIRSTLVTPHVSVPISSVLHVRLSSTEMPGRLRPSAQSALTLETKSGRKLIHECQENYPSLRTLGEGICRAARLRFEDAWGDLDASVPTMTVPPEALDLSFGRRWTSADVSKSRRLETLLSMPARAIPGLTLARSAGGSSVLSWWVARQQLLRIASLAWVPGFYFMRSGQRLSAFSSYGWSGFAVMLAALAVFIGAAVAFFMPFSFRLEVGPDELLCKPLFLGLPIRSTQIRFDDLRAVRSSYDGSLWLVSSSKVINLPFPSKKPSGLAYRTILEHAVERAKITAPESR